MRFDTPVYFRKTIPGDYDASTGNYLGDKVEEVRRFASVTDSGIKTLNLIYGKLKEGSRVVRLQNHYKEPFDNIQIGETIYRVDFSRRANRRNAFVVSEIQGGGQSESKA